MPNLLTEVQFEIEMVLDFSFIYGGIRYFGRDLSFIDAGGEEICRLHSLKITRRHRYYESGEETCYSFENAGETDSLLLESICDADGIVSVPDSAFHGEATGSVIRLFGAKGSDWSRLEFTPFSNELVQGESLYFSGSGGRPSQSVLPFFDINGGREGCILAIGWTGQWFAGFSGEQGGAHFKCGVENVSLRLRPKEKIRTCSVFVLPYKNGQNDGHNAFRRAVLSALGMRAGACAPLSLSLWGGTTSAYMTEAIKRARDAGFSAEYIWIDAGWHGESTNDCPDEFTDEWSKHTGDWRINKRIHPDGLQSVAREAKQNGSKLLLWFEPERAHSDTPVVHEHPEWFFRTEQDEFRNLLHLGDPQAYVYILETLCSLIKELGVACYRQDMNMDPLPLWEKYEGGERKGFLQIEHVQALYALWDTLKKEFPHLIIDNCASGGRRLDWETCKRSVPLWRSDFPCAFDAPSEGAQIHGIGLSWWLPVSGTGTKAEMTDLYDFRSAYAAALNVRFFTYEHTAAPHTEKLVRWIDEYKKIRSFFTEDYYPVFGFDGSDSAWGGWQYHSPKKGAGILGAFRRPECPDDGMTVALEGLEKEAVYRFVSFDALPPVQYSGRMLTEKGFPVCIPEKKSSRLFLYKKISG